MNLEATYDLIEQYLNNTLSAEELSLIEERLINDPDFAQEVEAHRMTHELIIDNALIDIKNELENIHSENLKNNQPKFKKSYYYLSALTIGLGVTGMLLYTKSATEKKSNQPIEQVLNKEVVPSKPKLIEDENHDLDEHKVLNSVPSKQDDSHQLKEISMPNTAPVSGTTPIFITTKQTQISNTLTSNQSNSIEPQKHIAEEAIAVNNKKNEIDKVTSNPSATTSLPINEKIPCEELIIKPNNYTLDKKTGDLTIDTRGIQGTPPFQFSIDGGKTFSENNYFKSEARSIYSLLVIDHKNCKSEVLDIKIPNTTNYVMYPDKQKYCNISLNRFEGVPVTIKISNARTGVIVFNATVSGISEYIWEGVNQNNTALDMGNYVYEVSSTHSPLVLSGLITIVR